MINVVNIPNLPESLIINLTSDLLYKADLISGYLKSSEIPLSVPLTINSVTTSNNLCNFPHPFRMILCGPPNTGKTNTIYNILLNNKPCLNV